MPDEDIILNRNRSQSKERPSSSTLQSSNISLKTQTEKDRKKYSSMVPRLEVVEIPNALRQNFEDMESDVEFLSDAHDNLKKNMLEMTGLIHQDPQAGHHLPVLIT